ncbi:MAG: ATP-dependent zinc protease family protein [Gammaproteobacteria bacterium]
MKRQIIGWREWLALPELKIDRIKAKIDTGARTSALHTFSIETMAVGGKSRVRFGIHPYQNRIDIEQYCTAAIIDERWVTDSGGHKEERYVIRTTLALGSLSWRIEMTLTDRDDMRFRMLLGRSAMRNKILVNPTRSYLTGRHRKKR